LAAVFSDLSSARIKALIDSGTARVNGRASKPSRRLKGGELVALVGSTGYVEIALRDGNAAARVGAVVGDTLQITL